TQVDDRDGRDGEDGREAGDKPRRTEDDAAADGRRGTAQRIAQVGPGKAGHVREVARYERQDARREEARKPGEGGHRDGEKQRAGACDTGEGLTHAATSDAR